MTTTPSFLAAPRFTVVARCLRVAGAAALAMCVAVVPAQAQRPLKVVLIGDSYSAGTGAAGASNVPGGCYRKPMNWAEQYVNEVRATGRDVDFVNRACHGAETRHLLTESQSVTEGREIELDGRWTLTDPELVTAIRNKAGCVVYRSAGVERSDVRVSAVDPGLFSTDVSYTCTSVMEPQIAGIENASADLLLLTIGGNDVGFENIAKHCLANVPVFGVRDRGRCENALLLANATLHSAGMRAALLAALEGALTKVRPGGRIVVLDYPFLERLDTFELDGYPAGRELRALQIAGDELYRDVVRELNLQRPGSVVFAGDRLSSVKSVFAGHEPASGRATALDDYLHEVLPLDVPESYHPNPDGHAAIANLLFGYADGREGFTTPVPGAQTVVDTVGSEAWKNYSILVPPGTVELRIALFKEGAEGDVVLHYTSDGTIPTEASARCVETANQTYSCTLQTPPAGLWRLAVHNVSAQSSSFRLIVNPVLPRNTASWGGNGDDSAQAVVADASGNTVIGGSTMSGGAPDVLLQKHDANGRPAWTQVWGGDGDDHVNGLAIDPDGNVYGVGSTVRGNGWTDQLILKWDRSGHLLWARRWGGSSWDVAYDVTIDPRGHLVVLGESYSGNAGTVLEVGSDGSLLATRSWQSATYTTFNAAAFDRAGNAYVLGTLWSFGSPTDTQLAVVKYDPAGRIVWSRYLPGPRQEITYTSRTIAIGANDRIYVVGGTESWGAGGWDALILELDTDGYVRWSRTWGGTAEDIAKSVSIDASGRVVVVGETASFGPDKRPFLLELSADGDILAQRVLLGSGVSGATSVAATPAGIVWAGYAPNANRAWSDVNGSHAALPVDVLMTDVVGSQGTPDPLGWADAGGQARFSGGTTDAGGGGHDAVWGRLSTNAGCQPPVAARVIGGWTTEPGGRVRLEADFSGTSLTFQWYQGVAGDTSIRLAGATDPTFDPGPIAATSAYWVRATNSCGSADSSTATVTVDASLVPRLNHVEQYRSDTGETIPQGGSVLSGVPVAFRATVSSPRGRRVRLEVELCRLPATFRYEASPETSSVFVETGTVAVTPPRAGLAIGEYGWIVRAVDDGTPAAVSAWIPARYPDFIVQSPMRLSEFRGATTASILPSDRVLLAGGPGSSVDLFTPMPGLALGQLSAGPRMTGNRSAHVASPLHDGTILVAGGGPTQAETYVDTGGVGAWVPAGVMHAVRHRAAATTLADGRVLVTGGDNGNNTTLASAELYEPTWRGWRTTGRMLQSRHTHTATRLADGRVLIVGGVDTTGGWAQSRNGLVSAELYDPATGLFVPTGSLTTGRWGHTATALPDGRVLVVGGYTSMYQMWAWTGAEPHATATVEVFDPTTGRFDSGPPLREARGHHTATLLADGTVLFAGGADMPTPPVAIIHATTEIVDVAAGTVTAGPPMLTARQDFTATRLASGAVLLAGGGDTVEIVQPTTRETGVSGLGCDTTASVQVGAARRVPVVAQPSGTTIAPTLLTWRSTNPRVAVVSNDPATAGLIIGAGQGTTTVSACLGHACAECVVTVTLAQERLIRLEVAPAGATLALGQSVTLQAYGAFNTDPFRRVTDIVWTSSAPGIVHVDAAGTATAVGHGTARITASSLGVSIDVVVDVPDGTTRLWPHWGTQGIASRQNHVAVLRSDGSVLLAGGSGSTATDVFTPVAGPGGGYVAAGPPTVAVRVGAGFDVLADGRPFFVGGQEWTSAEVLTGDAWAMTTGSLAQGRSDPRATTLADNRVLVTGGWVWQIDNGHAWQRRTLSAEVFDPTTGTFAPAGDMLVGRFAHTATRLADGRVLLTGGLDAQFGWGRQSGLRSAEVFDPVTGRFSAVGEMASPRFGHTATLLADGRVLVTGGWDWVDRYWYAAGSNTVASAEIWNPATGRWSDAGAMRDARGNHAAAVLLDEGVLVSGGTAPSGAALTSTDVYDPATGRWRPGPDLLGPRTQHTATTLHNGAVLIAGGGTTELEIIWPHRVTRSSAVTPVLTWTPAAHLPVGAGLGPAHLNAVANAAGQPVVGTFVYDPPAGTVLPVGTHVLGVTFTPDDTTTYRVALASTTVTVTTGPVTPTVTWAAPAAVSYGTALGPAQLAATAAAGGITVPGSFVYEPPAGTVLAAGTHTLRVTFTPADPATFGTASASVTLEVLPVQPSISSVTPSVGPTAGGVTVTIAGSNFPSDAQVRFGETAAAAPLHIDDTTIVVAAPPHDPGTVGIRVTGAGGVWADAAAAFTFESPANERFASVGNLATPRRSHTLTLLASGDVLVAGGLNGGSALASAERYDHGTGTFVTTSSMSQPRRLHSATLLPSGKVLMVGGFDNAREIASAELYDPETDTFTPTGSLNVARHSHAAALLPSGKVLIVAGFAAGTVLASAEVYDPQTGRFTLTGPLAHGRQYPTATRLHSGLVLVVGGVAGSTYLSSVELYDPATETFGPAESLVHARTGHTATLLADGRVLVTGGYNGAALDTAEVFVPETRRFVETSRMNHVRSAAAAVLLPSGQVLVLGGNDGAGGPATLAHATTELYLPGEGVFVPSGTMGHGRNMAVAVRLFSGHVLVAGGFDSAAVPWDLRTAEVYQSSVPARAPITADRLSVCGGASVSIAADPLPGAVWAWRGPGGFVTAERNLAWPFATPSMAGPYFVRASIDEVTTPSSPVQLSVVRCWEVSGVTPVTGPSTGGTAITVTGRGFALGADLIVGGVPATNVVVVDEATLTARAPAHAAGIVDVVVVSRGHSVTLPGAYSFVAPEAPTLTGVAPASGPVGTGVTISGTGLTGATALTFHGVAAAFRVTNDTTIETTVPAGATTGPVVVTTPGGTATSAADFVVTNQWGRRVLPVCYAPGYPLTVTIELGPAPSVQVQGAEDGLPESWTIGPISDDGAWDGANRRVAWGPFADALVRTLSYVVTPPGDASAQGVFGGQARFDGGGVLLGGPTTLPRCETHPADGNDDWQLTIGEVTAYGSAWKRGTTWALPPTPIPIAFVTRAGYLWRTGEQYRRDDNAECPLCWVPVEARPLSVREAMLLPPGADVRPPAFR